MQWRGRGAAVAATVLVGLMAAGCTGDATPTGPTGTHSPSASADAPSATPTVSPTLDMSVAPARPDAMATPSADGAAAAASYFMADLYAHMYASRDIAAWDAMADDACAFCTSVLDDVRAMVSAGESETGTGVLVEQATGAEILPGESYTATLVARQSPTKRMDATGKSVGGGSGGRYELLVALGWNGDWVVRAVDVHELEPA